MTQYILKLKTKPKEVLAKHGMLMLFLKELQAAVVLQGGLITVMLTAYSWIHWAILSDLELPGQLVLCNKEQEATFVLSQRICQN